MEVHALSRGRPANEAFPAAKAAALKALALDDRLAEAHASLALVVWLYDWDWPKADEEFRHAIALDPGYVTARHWYGLFLGEMGRFPEAIEQMKEALLLDPISPALNGDLGRVYYWARRYDEAREQYRQAFALGAGISFRYEASYVYEASDPSEYYRAEVALNWARKDWLEVLRQHGKDAFWRAIAKDLRPDPSNYYYCFEVFSRVGDNDRAFDALNQAYRLRDHRLSQLKVEPILDRVRSDPRFGEMLRRMKLTP